MVAGVTLKIVCVDKSLIYRTWPYVEPLLRKAFIRTGFALFSDLERDVFDGKALVWIAWDGKSIMAAWAIALHPTDAGLVCSVLACGGERMCDWLPLVGAMEQFAKDEGCKRVRIVGRKGWSRVLDGYREKHVVLEKELSE